MFTLLVVNAQHIKYVPGHKTDKKDSAWLCKLLRAGLLKGSFIPDRAQRDLRDLTRYRRKKVQEVTAEKNRMLKAIRRSIASLEEEIAELESEIDRRCEPAQEEIERLCTIPGVDKTGAKELIAEIGVNMEVFPTAANLASWSGVSPGNNESAGKKKART